MIGKFTRVTPTAIALDADMRAQDIQDDGTTDPHAF